MGRRVRIPGGWLDWGVMGWLGEGPGRLAEGGGGGGSHVGGIGLESLDEGGDSSHLAEGAGAPRTTDRLG